MVGHAHITTITCYEGRHHTSRSVGVEHVSRREKANGAASENSTLSSSMHAGGKREGMLSNKKNHFGVSFFRVIDVNSRWRAERYRGGHTSPDELQQVCVGYVTFNTLRYKLSQTCYSRDTLARGTRGPHKVRDNLH